jgi:hypothetical protein
MIGIVLSSFTWSASAAYLSGKEASTSFERNTFEDPFKRAMTDGGGGTITPPGNPSDGGTKLGDAVGGDISYTLILCLVMGYGGYVFRKFKTEKNKV